MMAGFKVTALALGNYFTCAIVAEGEVKCWGRNDYGQLGVPPTRSRAGAALDQSSDAISVAGGRAGGWEGVFNMYYNKNCNIFGFFIVLPKKETKPYIDNDIIPELY